MVLLLLCNAILQANCVDDPYIIMRKVSEPLIEEMYGDQFAIAYVKVVGEQFKGFNNAHFKSITSENLNKEYNGKHGFVFSKPTKRDESNNNNGKIHSEETILSRLPKLINDILLKSEKNTGMDKKKSRKVDVYFYTYNSPCCNVKKRSKDVCGLTSCARRISDFVKKAFSDTHGSLNKFFLSWSIPYVSTNDKSTIPSAEYNKQYFYSMMQLFQTKKCVKDKIVGDRLVFVLEEPDYPYPKTWFQKSLAQCLNKIYISHIDEKPSSAREVNFYGFINRATAQCVLRPRETSKFSYINIKCWKYEWDQEYMKAKQSKSRSYGESYDDYVWFVMIKPCLKRLRTSGTTILGPPLNTKYKEGTNKIFSTLSNDLNLKI